MRCCVTSIGNTFFKSRVPSRSSNDKRLPHLTMPSPVLEVASPTEALYHIQDKFAQILEMPFAFHKKAQFVSTSRLVASDAIWVTWRDRDAIPVLRLRSPPHIRARGKIYSPRSLTNEQRHRNNSGAYAYPTRNLNGDG